jgi:predicted Holliday junction resolvase-like endonuclease
LKAEKTNFVYQNITFAMPLKNSKHQEIIQALRNGNFYAECPNTEEDISLKKAALFDNDNFTDEALEIYQQQLDDIRATKERLKKIKEIGTTKSESGAQYVNIGKILERLAPALGSFRFNHNDCRSLFDPIDYVIFEGLSKSGTVNKIFFIDIKTGNKRLEKRQKEIKDVILNNKVSFKKY